MLYPNLEAELRRKGILREEIARLLGVNLSTMSAKLNKPDRLKLCEARLIWETWFMDIEFAKLFEISKPESP